MDHLMTNIMANICEKYTLTLPIRSFLMDYISSVSPGWASLTLLVMKVMVRARLHSESYVESLQHI